METYGADFSYTRPNPAVLEANGWSFVLGYVSRSTGKVLTNWRDYVNAGLGVAFVFEDSAVPNLSNGKADGEFCEQWLRSNGLPFTVPLFFAIDSDVPSSLFPAIHSYASDFNLATNSPTGPYGKFNLIEYLVTPGQQPSQIGWQTAAWSAGKLSQKCNVYQRATHHHALPGYASNSYDENVLINQLGFVRNGPVPPPPPPIPVPPPPPPPVFRYYYVHPGDSLTSIANEFHTTVTQLVRWNPFITNPNYIQVGWKLRVG